MTADAWKFYDSAREFIADGTVDLDNDTFKVALFLSTSNAATVSTNTVISDLTNEHANANGYTTGGVSVTAVISAANRWLRSGSSVKFDVDDASWTASGGSITARFAVLYDSTTSKLVAYCLLDNAPADVTATNGNPFVVTISASGVFTLTGA